jgi:hypothetical protein
MLQVTTNPIQIQTHLQLKVTLASNKRELSDTVNTAVSDTRLNWNDQLSGLGCERKLREPQKRWPHQLQVSAPTIKTDAPLCQQLAA